jgi:hypothetical protein
MRLKSTPIIILILLMSFSLTACSSSKNKTSEQTSNTEAKRNDERKVQKQQAFPERGTSESDSYDKRRLASFRATTMSVAASAIQCADESKLSKTSFLPGSNICSDTAVSDITYPSPAKGVCDEGAYGIEVTDETSGDGIYQIIMACTIAGTEHATTCNDMGCSTAP